MVVWTEEMSLEMPGCGVFYVKENALDIFFFCWGGRKLFYIRNSGEKYAIVYYMKQCMKS